MTSSSRVRDRRRETHARGRNRRQVRRHARDVVDEADLAVNLERLE
ncbi:hypothetical protein [Natrinema gari]|nr:hypothetical protein [Natrinema gari]AFO59350.1 hypothetical protein NJ7G_4137 [Natrinema sp. J7-2]